MIQVIFFFFYIQFTRRKLKTKNTIDYGALIIKGSAAIVIVISLSLIFLAVGNMVYQSFASNAVLRQNVSKNFLKFSLVIRIFFFFNFLS
ncbi:unnamed protein product [Dracunculus medinensis]|uniref:DUF1146 domain-containing protein n=1 Tax=Dracunculus medinensis TaxID=318479 RepID=A0A0N4U196_DRAME|nr:unnamed protein product [Dracunculus medinensis]